MLHAKTSFGKSSPARRSAKFSLGSDVFCTHRGALLLAVYEIARTFLRVSTPEFGTAIGELLLVIVLGMGEVLALFALRHTAKEREFITFLKAQEIWTEEEFRKARGRIFQRLRNPEVDLTQEEKEDALGVCRKLDGFARLRPYLGTETMLDTWDDPLGKAWVVLEKTVNEERGSSAHWEKK